MACRMRLLGATWCLGSFGLLWTALILTGLAPVAEAAAVKLASGRPFDVAVRNGYVYWSELPEEFCTSASAYEQGSLKRVPTTGGTVTTLYSSCDFSPGNISVDDDWIYAIDWDADQIVRVPTKGGSPQQLAIANGSIYYRGLEVDDTFVFWADHDGLKRTTKDGLSSITLVATNVNNLTTDISHVYWSGGEMGNAAIKRVNKSGGTAQTLASGLYYPSDIVVDESYVYWADIESIRRMPKIGGTTSYTPSYSNPGTQVAHLALRGALLFWTETDSQGLIGSGKVRYTPKPGGAQSSIATGLSGPGGINLDGQYVYWGDGDGIKRADLPTAPTVQIKGGYTFFKPESGEQGIPAPVFLRGGGQPTFSAKLNATSVAVDILAPSTSSGLTVTKSLTLQKSGNEWTGKWNWTSSGWSGSEQIPVGAYVARFKPTGSGAAGVAYELPFYVVFNPQEVGVSASHPFTLKQPHGEYALWFYSSYGTDWVLPYWLHPDDKRVFGQAIGLVSGETSTSAAAQKVLTWLDPEHGKAKCVCTKYDSSGKCIQTKAEPIGDPTSGYRWRYTICTSSKDVIKLLQRTDQMVQCADSAGLCVAMLRSVGIPSHPVTADAAVEYGTATWGFDTWVEARFKGSSGTQWYAAHPHEGINWTTRSTAGGWGVASKKNNDIIIMADDKWPITMIPYTKVAQFGYGTSCKEPEEMLTMLESWVQHLCQNNPTGGGYWSKGHWECSPPQGSDIVIQLDQPEYFVGDTAYITISIYNSGNAPLVGQVDIDMAIDQLLTKQFPDSLLSIGSGEFNVLPNESVDVTLEYKLPESLSSFDSHLIVAKVGEERAMLPFSVEPLYEAQLTAPEEVLIGEPFNAQLVISNISVQAIENIFVELKVPFGVEITEGGVIQTIEILYAGEQTTLDWDLVARTPSELAAIEAEIASETGGGSLEIKGIDVVELARPEELVAAFAFGSRLLDCPTFNDPAIDYVMVHHGTPSDLAYDLNRGWGYEVIYREGSPYGDRSGYGVFGPFDDSPNNREKFAEECPEHLYNSFIGAKDFTNECSEATIGDPCTPCATALTPEGIIFHVDVPNGLYRFVGAFGDADNVHAHRILAEDGGSGPPEEIGPNHVVLVSNFDQAQQTIGEADPVELGEGVYARVGFDGKIPPPGDGNSPSPQFVNMEQDGLATDGPANSPILEVTQGYIRIHQLQGNSNDGPGGPRDGNGGDIVILELWKVEPERVGCSTEGLVAYYAFENDTLDSSGNGLDGVIIGDTTFADGVEGMALDFNGDDYVDCDGAAEFSFTDAMTVSTWVNIRSRTTAWMALIAKGENAWRLGVNNETTGIHFAFSGGTRGWQAANTTTELPFDEWHHVAATYDTSVGALVYIDGVVDASNPDLDGIDTNEFSLLLGDNPEATGRFFDGMLDEVKIYNRALSAEEIDCLVGLR